MVRSLASVAFTLAFTVVAGSAASFSNLVIFGDSLSDNRQAFPAAGGPLPPPANLQEFTWRVWTFYRGLGPASGGTPRRTVARILGGVGRIASTQPFLNPGGTNYAV